MPQPKTRTDLVQLESGLWAILARTGKLVNCVETGHVDRNLAVQDLACWRQSGSLSPNGRAWLAAAERLRGNVAQGKMKRGGDRISRETILTLLMRQAYRCPLTGVEFEPVFDGPWQPSVDRIDSDLGYVEGNLRVVTYIANIAMNVWGEGPLREMAGLVAALGIAPGLRPDGPVGRCVPQTRLRLTHCQELENG